MKTLLRYLSLVMLATLAVSASAGNGRAVSLKVLQSLMAKGQCPQEARELCGMTRVTGYVVDRKGRDLILIGEAADGLPALHLDDFVVALRNATLQYAERKGRTYYYTSPGCSIDPNPKVVGQLQQVGDKLGSLADPSNAQTVLDEWAKVGSQPQNVRVLGVPWDTRFAKVMVDADYYMKRLVNGSVDLGIPGLISVTDMALAATEADLAAGRAYSVPGRSMNRFWFCPGENTYAEEDGTVMLATCQVKLLTEEEFLSTSGQIRGTGSADVLARKFANSFTAHYQEIAAQRPIYKELEGLFRFAELAKLMTDKRAGAAAGLKLDYLTKKYQVTKTPVGRTLPGLTYCRESTVERSFDGGTAKVYLWFPSCGGVSMDFHPKLVKMPKPPAPISKPPVSKSTSTASSGKPAATPAKTSQPAARPSTLRKAVLGGRRSSGSLSWSF